MSREAQIAKQIKRLVINTESFAATVKSVDRDNDTAVVLDKDDFEFVDVRLRSVIDNGDGLVVYPADGSEVIVTKIEGSVHGLYVSAVSEVEAVVGTIGSMTFDIDKDGARLERQGRDLKSVLNDLQDYIGDLCDEVSQIVVLQGTGPNVPNIQAIKVGVTQTNQNDLNTILK